MGRGEVSRFTVRPDYAYGDAGSPPTVPGGVTLIYEMELVDWTSAKVCENRCVV